MLLRKYVLLARNSGQLCQKTDMHPVCVQTNTFVHEQLGCGTIATCNSSAEAEPVWPIYLSADLGL